MIARLVARNERELHLLTLANQPTELQNAEFWLGEEPDEDYKLAEDGSNVIIDFTEDNKLLGLIES